MTDANNETKLFQRWLVDHLMPSEFSHLYLFKVDEDGDYVHDFVRNYWDAWEARAALAASNQEAWVAALLNAPNPEQTTAATPAVGGEDDTLPRCKHGNCLKDGAGEILEPPCGCRALPASPLRGREAGIKECIELIEKKFLVGWTITQNGLAREDEANDILEALRELSASPPEQPAAGDGETKA